MRNMMGRSFIPLVISFVLSSCGSSEKITYAVTDVSSNYGIVESPDISLSISVDAHPDAGVLATRFYILNRGQSDIEIDAKSFSIIDNRRILLIQITPEDVAEMFDPDNLLSYDQKASMASQGKRYWLNEVPRSIPAGTAIQANLFWDMRSVSLPLLLRLNKDNLKMVYIITDKAPMKD